MISQSVTSILISELFFVLTLPLALLVIMKLRTRCTILPFFTGAGIYLVFITFLESVISGLLLSGAPAGERIQNSPVLFLIFVSVLGIIFQEGGRLFGFAVLLKDRNKREDAVNLGIGFAAVEGLVMVGLSVLMSISYVALYNEFGLQGLMDTLENVNEAEVAGVIEELRNTTVLDSIMVSLERICYMAMSIELSVLMFYGYRKKSSKHYGYAALLHAVANVPMVLAKYELLKSRTLMELLFVIILAGGGYLAVKAYRDLKEEKRA